MSSKPSTKLNTNDIAISVKNVSKTFRIPHEKVTSIRGAVTGLPATLGSALGVGALKRKKGYEEFKALDDVSFEVKKGEFFGIIGRNGSGKSTLLKILAGIYTADAGKVKINGMISPFLELGIGFNPELSGRDNVYLNATVLGMTKKQIDEKFDDIVKFSELERFIDQKLKNYSSGMQVRLAFSVSIHANRDILLMDEVLAVGDSNFQSKCILEFSRYKKDGKTVILVTHDIGIIQKYCDKAMLIRSGKVVKIGTAEDVGNEYICNNIADEDGRMLADSEDFSGNEHEKELNKLAMVTKVDFLDKDGIKKNVFETGDNIVVRVYFKCDKTIDELNFGISIYSSEGSAVFGISTAFDKINTKNMVKNGFFEIEYPNIKIKTNSYFIKVVIMDKADAIMLDFFEKSVAFKIVSRNKNAGIVELDYRWKC
ncbi:MAG: ABC transporter ATP-binding protein [Candidatus Moraniibacteriota bacterium]